MRNGILFSGTSNTFGLGLEIELRPKYNDDEYLTKFGITLPLPREKEDEYYWKTYRWSTLVCNETNYIQYNIHDIKYDYQIGGNAVETLWVLNKNKKDFSDLMSKIKYVILEMGYIRWWDENLHGKGIDEYPSTIREILDLIDNPKSDHNKVINAMMWLQKVDSDIYFAEATKRLIELKKEYSDVTFLILPWQGTNDNILSKTADNLLKNDFIDIGNYHSISHILHSQKLRVGDVAKAYNGNFKYNEKDEHASSQGHRIIADLVINHINKLDNENK